MRKLTPAKILKSQNNSIEIIVLYGNIQFNVVLLYVYLLHGEEMRSHRVSPPLLEFCPSWNVFLPICTL